MLNSLVLLLARLGTQLRLAVGIGDALLLGYFLDQFGPPGEASQDIGRNPRDLEIVALAIHAESEVLKLIGKPHAKCRLEVWGITLEVPESGRPSSDAPPGPTSS